MSVMRLPPGSAGVKVAMMAQPQVDSAILGVRTPEHLENNIAAAEGTLSEEALAACDEVWAGIRGPFFKYNR